MLRFLYGYGSPIKVQDFQCCMREVGLTDIPYSGSLFTRSNRREKGFLAKKLDRIMANFQWLKMFPEYYAQFLAPDISDHSAGWD